MKKELLIACVLLISVFSTELKAQAKNFELEKGKK